MTRYDGSRFIAAAGDCCLPDQPLDAFVEALFRNNALWLLREGAWFHHGFWRNQSDLGATGDRAWASSRRTCWFIAPFYVQPTMDELQIAICGRVATLASPPISGSNRVTIWAELAGVGEARVEFVATGGYTDLHLTIPCSRRPAALFATQLRLWIKSEVTELLGSPTSGELATQRNEVAASGLYPAEPDGPRPADGTYNEQVTLLNGSPIEHLYLRAVDRMIGWPEVTSFGRSVQRARLSYLQVRGVALRELHQMPPYPLAAHRAGIAVLGQAAGLPATALLTASRRAQLVSLGTPGALDYSRCTGSDLPEGYTIPFQWIPLAGGEKSKIHRQPIWLDEAGVDVEVRLLYVPVVVTAGYAAGEFDALRAEGASAEWQFAASLVEYQKDSGAPLSIEAGAVTRVVEHLPTDESGVWPFLLQRRWAAGASGDDYAPAAQRPTHKEGQLYGPDLALVQEMAWRVTVEGAPTGKATCLEVSAEQVGAITFSTPTSEVPEAGRVQLVVVGLSVWVHPAPAPAPGPPTPYTGKQIAAAAATAIPSPLIFATGQQGRSAAWQELARQANRLWARRGSRGLGRWFDEGSDQGAPWVTVSDTLTQVAGYTGVNERLSSLSGPVWALHHVRPGQDRVRLTLEAHLRNLELECRYIALDTGATLATATLIAGTQWDLVQDTQELTIEASHKGADLDQPKRLILISLRAQRYSALDGAGALTYWQIREEPITNVADLPS